MKNQLFGILCCILLMAATLVNAGLSEPNSTKNHPPQTPEKPILLIENGFRYELRTKTTDLDGDDITESIIKQRNLLS